MDTDKIVSWVDGVLRDGADTAAYLLTQEPDDSFGWGQILHEMWTPDDVTRPTASGLLLVGPAGCGKHTAAHHMLHLLADRNYSFVFQEGEELAALGEDVGEIGKALDALLDHCYDEHTGMCLILERTAGFPFSRALYRYLGLSLCRYYMRRGEASRRPGPKDRPIEAEAEPEYEYDPFFLILIEEEEPALPALLRSRLQLCRMALPNEYRRRQFLLNYELEGIQTNKGLLEKTEGLSYAQLGDLLNSLRAQAAPPDFDYESGADDCLLLEQLPPTDTLERSRQQALDSLSKLAERTPQLLETLRVAPLPPVITEQARPQTAKVDNNPSTEETIADRREELDSMPISDLSIETFGSEKAEALKNLLSQKSGEEDDIQSMEAVPESLN